ncbi:hypothetical protein ACFX2A_025131 [Malus domestica]
MAFEIGLPHAFTSTSLPRTSRGPASAWERSCNDKGGLGEAECMTESTEALGEEECHGSLGEEECHVVNLEFELSGGDDICGEIQMKTTRTNPRSTQPTMRMGPPCLREREKAGRSKQQSETNSSFSFEVSVADPGVFCGGQV